MAKIHDIILTPEMEKAAIQCLQYVSGEDLKALSNHLDGGFRNPSAICHRLEQMIQVSGPLPPWLLNVIRAAIPACAAVSALSIEALRDQFDILLAVAGPPELLLALAADARPEVQKLALERLSASSQAISEADREAARDLWINSVDAAFVRFTGFQITSPKEDAGESALNRDEVKRLEADAVEEATTVSDLKRKLQREREAHAQKLQHLTASAKGERERLTKEIKELQDRVNNLSADKKALEQRNRKLAEEMRESVKAAVQIEMASAERKWLADAAALESVVATDSTMDLLNRVKCALDRQEKQDRHSGNRQKLQQRLEELRGASKKLNDARQNALQPIRDLETVARQVDQEIARIESKLGHPPSTSITDHLLPHINESDDPAALQKYQRLAENLVGLKRLSADESRRLYEAIQRRQDVLAAATRVAKPISSSQSPFLQQLLDRNLECCLLLDGHNIVHALDHLQGLFENNRPGPKARNRLQELTRKLVAARPNVSTCIFFDGPMESNKPLCPNLMVEFSGGQGNNKADLAVVRHLKKLQDAKCPIFVVTNDQTLKAHVEILGAKCLTTGVFDSILHDFNCLV